MLRKVNQISWNVSIDVAPHRRGITLCQFVITRSWAVSIVMVVWRSCIPSLRPRDAYIKLPDIFAFPHAIFKWRHKSHVRHSRRAPRTFCLSSTSQSGNIYGSVQRQTIKHVSKRKKSFLFGKIKRCFNSYFVLHSGGRITFPSQNWWVHDAILDFGYDFEFSLTSQCNCTSCKCTGDTYDKIYALNGERRWMWCRNVIR